MPRFLAISLIITLTFASLFLLFLISPLPKAVVEAVMLRKFPGTGYFKIKEMKLIPWQPLEIRNLEYQIQRDPQGGIVRAEKLRLKADWRKLIQRKKSSLEIENLSFDSPALSLDNLDLELPFTFFLPPGGGEGLESQKGRMRVSEIRAYPIRFRGLVFNFDEKENQYQGNFEARWTGGAITGQLEWEPFRKEEFRIEASLSEMNLEVFSREVGGVFERASGRCQGTFRFQGEGSKVLKVRGELVCPKPGGRIKAKFLKSLGDWIPQGTARSVFQEEVEGKEDYYYDEARVEIHNEKPGYWTIRFLLINPRLRLDIPIDISASSFETLWGNEELQKLVKRWSESD